jgi:hypothetical protein
MNIIVYVNNAINRKANKSASRVLFAPRRKAAIWEREKVSPTDGAIAADATTGEKFATTL